MWRAAVIFGLAVAALSASAADWTTRTGVTLSQVDARVVRATPGSIMVGPMASTWLTRPAGGMIQSSVLKGPGPRGVIDVDARVVVTSAKAAKAIARSLPVVSTALAVAQLLEDLNITEGPGGTVLMDPGQPTQSGSGWRVTHSATGCTAVAVVAVEAAQQVADCVLPMQGTCPVWSGTCYTYHQGPQPVTCSTGTASCTIYRYQKQYVCSSGVCTYQSQSQPVPVTIGTLQATTVTGLCPAGTEPAVWDGTKCTTAQPWPQAPVVDVEARLVPYVEERRQTVIPAVADKVPVESEAPPELVPVSPPAIDREVTTRPDGSTSVRDTVWQWEPGVGEYRWVPSVTVKDYPPGATPEPPGAVTDGTVSTGGVPAQVEVFTCGLPGKPPCKIDESGTPQAVDTFPQPADILAPITGAISSPPKADSSWGFAFSFPSSCSAIVVGPFGDRSVTLDLCEWQPMVHDLLSMVWVAAGFWWSLSLLGRTFLGGE